MGVLSLESRWFLHAPILWTPFTQASQLWFLQLGTRDPHSEETQCS